MRNAVHSGIHIPAHNATENVATPTTGVLVASADFNGDRLDALLMIDAFAKRFYSVMRGTATVGVRFNTVYKLRRLGKILKERERKKARATCACVADTSDVRIVASTKKKKGKRNTPRLRIILSSHNALLTYESV